MSQSAGGHRASGKLGRVKLGQSVTLFPECGLDPGIDLIVVRVGAAGVKGGEEERVI